LLPGRQYTPQEILQLLWCRRWIIAGMTLLATLAAVAVGLRIPDTYKSETLILVIPQKVPDSYVRSPLIDVIESRLRSINEQILSRTSLEKVIVDFDLYPELRGKVPMEQIVARMRPDIDVEPIRSDAFKVSYLADTPRRAMIVTERLASMYIEENARDREKTSLGINQFLESQLEEQKRRLVEHETRLEEFRRRNSGELPSQVESNLQALRNTQTQITSLSESIDRDRDRRLSLEKSVTETLTSGADSGGGDSSATGVARTIEKLDRARGELAALELRLKPNHPDVTTKKRQIRDLQNQIEAESRAVTEGRPAAPPTASNELIRKARVQQAQADIAKLDKEIASKEAEISSLKDKAAEVQRRIDALPAHESELVAITRDYETQQKIYNSLLAKREESKIAANLERQQVGEQFKILDPARLPERPFSPNRLRLDLIGFALGLVSGLGLAAFLEYRDTSLRTEDEIVKMLVLPVVAAIPILISVADRRRRRRNVILGVCVSVCTVVGGFVAALWQLGYWEGMR
jgi:polysaccharide chain length determinant protein (PEP-CTERM system associated)